MLPPPEIVYIIREKEGNNHSTFGMFKYVSLFNFVLLVAAAPSAPRQSCADVTVIFARGTFETPPIGTVVGPPFESALKTALENQSLNFIGVDYPADLQGFEEGGDPNGAKTMAADITNAVNSCPDTKVVMSGYRLVLH